MNLTSTFLIVSCSQQTSLGKSLTITLLESYYRELLEMGQDAFAVPEFSREPLSAELLVARDARRALPVERFAGLSRTDNSDVDQIAPLFNCDLIIFITDDDLISVVDQEFQ